MIEPPVLDSNGEEVEPADMLPAEEGDDEGFEEELEDPTVSLDNEFLPDVLPALTQVTVAKDLPVRAGVQTMLQNRPSQAGNIASLGETSSFLHLFKLC